MLRLYIALFIVSKTWFALYLLFCYICINNINSSLRLRGANPPAPLKGEQQPLLYHHDVGPAGSVAGGAEFAAHFPVGVDAICGEAYRVDAHAFVYIIEGL